MNKQTDVLIIGGGFAGAAAAQDLAKKGLQTILVDKKDYFEVTYATLRNLAAPAITGNAPRKRYADFLSGEFIQDEVLTLDAQVATLANGIDISFRYAIIASGSRYPNMPIAKSNQAMTIDARNSELQQHHQQLQQAKKVLVIGGGVVGVELAGEIASAFPEKSITLAHRGDLLLDGFKPKAQRKAAVQLQQLGVKLAFGSHYQAIDGRHVEKNSGSTSDADLVLQAVGTELNNEFLQTKLPHILDRHGRVSVNERLEVPAHPHLYALGDIADAGEAKLGYLAQQQGNYAARAILAREKGKRGKPYKRNPLMALVPTGQHSGVVQLPFAVSTWSTLVGIKQKDLFISKTYKGLGTAPNPKQQPKQDSLIEGPAS